MSDWKPGELDYRISADAGKVHWNEGYCNETCRPVVVIDPDDAEQTRRLAVLYDAAFERMHPELYAEAPELDDPDDDEVMAAALREFADPTPPKPEEPTGLGAVVESADGSRYLRHRISDLAPWLAEKPDDPSRPYRYYHDLDVVRVLSEGVTP